MKTKTRFENGILELSDISPDLLIKTPTEMIKLISKKAAEDLIKRRDDYLESFLISGAMPRDLTLVMFPAMVNFTEEPDGNVIWSFSQRYEII